MGLFSFKGHGTNTGNDQNGLKGCGSKVAYGLAKYGLGDSLLDAAKMHHDDEAKLADFLNDWREELRTLLHTDPDGYIGRRSTSIAKNIHNNFPIPQVILAYTHPLTSWSRGGSGVAAVPPIHLREPDIHGLALFCTRHFGWDPNTLHAKFKSVVWEGACVKMLGQVCVLRPWVTRWKTHIGYSPTLYKMQVGSRRLAC